MVSSTSPRTDDSAARFQAARDRYNQMMQSKNTDRESLDSDSDANAMAVANALDLLRKMANDNKVAKIPNVAPVNMRVASNQNKQPGLPVPLPVKPIDPQALVMQSQTNDLIKKLNGTVAASSLPQPVKIDDSKIAHEATLKDVSEILSNIYVYIKELSINLLDKFREITGTWSNQFDDYAEEEQKKTGWITRVLGKTIDYVKGVHPGFVSFAESIQRLGKPLIDRTNKTVDYLKRIYDLQKKRMVRSNIEESRDTLTPSSSRNPFSGIFRLIFPDDSTGRKVINGLKSIGSFFHKIGEFGESKILGSTGGGGILTKILPMLGSGGMIAKVLGLFGGIAGFIGAVAGSVAFASLYAMFKHPEQLVALLGAFGNLFQETIVPALEWITKEIIPPLSVAFAALMVAADYLLDTVGTYVNEKLTYIIGTALPDVLKMFGRMIDTVWQGVKELTLRIAGIFGVGEYGEEGIINNLLNAMLTIGDTILETISVFATEVIKSLGLADVFGLKEGEGIYGRIKRFFMEDIPNFAVDLFNSTVEYIKELNPIETIKKKLGDFVDNIVGMIPSWEDVKKFMVDSIPSWTPDVIKDYFVKKLMGPSDSTTEPMRAPIYEPARKNIMGHYNVPLDPWSRTVSTPSSMIYAPTNNTNNVSNTNSVNRGGVGIGNTSPPSNRLDDMIFRANPY